MLVPARTEEYGYSWSEAGGRRWETSEQTVSLGVIWFENTQEAVVEGIIDAQLMGVQLQWCVEGLRGIKPTTALMIAGKDDVKAAEEFTDERVIQALLRVREAFSGGSRK